MRCIGLPISRDFIYNNVMNTYLFGIYSSPCYCQINTTFEIPNYTYLIVYLVITYLLLNSEHHDVLKNILSTGAFGVLSSRSSLTFRKKTYCLKFRGRRVSRTNKRKHQTELLFFWLTFRPWRSRHHIPLKRWWTYTWNYTALLFAVVAVVVLERPAD
jgi:hypothetical protein